MKWVNNLITAAGFVLIASVGHAATYTNLGTCAVTDVSATADSCFGAVTQNDSAGLLNNNTFGTDIGLFGTTNWSFVAKKDIGGSLSGTDIGLSVTVDTAGTAGNWSVTAGALDIFARVVIILKATNGFTAYLYEPGSDAGSSGTWATTAFSNKNGKTQSLSHLSIYSSGKTPRINIVPVPAAGFLLLGALGGLAALRRRRQKPA